MIIVDSSAMVDALVDDPVNPALLALIADEELHAPALLDFEVISALRGHCLAGKLDQVRLDEATEDFTALRIQRYQMTDLLRHILNLKDNFTTHDAAYIVLSQALEAPLITSDNKMKEAEKIGIDVRVMR
ncbi:type II toxin-antitoxin system VapC family toxin [Nonomuraea polychroma]|uniref:type II toxin-antitoxin system VapC family toxin n=1 Tax=Nonomuraea polychroma TaxID=46176 RepID=UPI003D923AAF